jgi:hypothetical protein
MKKADIIETIKRAEAEAWLALAKHDMENKPVVVTWEQEKDYAENHPGHRAALGAWYSLKVLMDELNINSEFAELHSEATDINHKIWLREQNAKGIYYDERGNRIA